jgi:trypsin-like peptidase
MRRAFAVLACLVTGCAAHPRASVHVVPAASESTADDASRYFSPPISLLYRDERGVAVPEDAIVRIVGPQMTCTGTLVDEDLVLTAHHCVVQRGPHGEFTKELVSPRELHIELGGDYLAWGHVGITHIVRPHDKNGVPCGEQGKGGDLAILVLPRKLVGLGVIAPRLDEPPAIDERLHPVGFGRCAMSDAGISRKDREGGKVVGLTAETFEMRASICPGDSGGPVLRGWNELVGVVSMSVMDGDERTTNLSVMARVDALRGLFSNARQVADGVSESELPPVACSR